MELRLDGAIDKVEDLARDVELNKSMSGKSETEKESMAPMSMVAELSEYQYGSFVSGKFNRLYLFIDFYSEKV